MRLAYLTGRYPAVSHTFVLREIRGLRQLGVDVTSFSVWRTQQGDLISQAEREEFDSTYPLLPPRRRDWAAAHLRALRRPGDYLRALRRALAVSPSTPRGVALGTLWFLEAIVLWDRCRRAGVGHVHVHLNGTAPSVALVAHAYAGGQLTFSMTVHGPSEFYDVHAEALAEKVRAAAAVVCISDFARSQLMGLVDHEQWGKLHVVHCGVDPSIFSARPRPGDDAGELEVLCVGRLVPVKGQGVLLEAIGLLAERGLQVRATFVGDGPTRPALEARAAALGVADRVRFEGSVSQEVIRDHYAAADVFCLPSFAEGVPVVLMEAMAMEIPVVTTTVMGIGELVEHEVAGLLVRPARADLVAGALERLADDPALRARLGEAGRRKVLEEFDVQGSVGQLHELFSGIVESTGPPGSLRREVVLSHG